MKKFYATILATLFSCGAMLAQNDHTLNFVQNGQVLADGATITVSEIEYIDLGDSYIVEMNPNLLVRNNSNTSLQATMDCDGIGANYRDIEFCFGNCLAWGLTPHLSNTITLEKNSLYVTFIHIGGIFVDEKNYTISDAGVKLTLYPESNPQDCVTLTLLFDTTGAGVKEIKDQKAIEVYNLCGKKIGTSTTGLSAGVYIIKQGNISRKVVIK